MDKPEHVKLDDFESAELACIKNTVVWLAVAEDYWDADCGAVLFAHALTELGKAVDVFRASRSLGWTVDHVLSHRGGPERLLDQALEIVHEEDVGPRGGSPHSRYCSSRPRVSARVTLRHYHVSAAYVGPSSAG